MTETLPTKLRLAQAIRDFAPDGRLEEFAKLAEQGHYDEFESPLALPITVLIADMAAHDAGAIATRAIAGEFDPTREEANAWAQREAAAVSGVGPRALCRGGKAG